MKGFSANFDQQQSSSPSEPQKRQNLFTNDTTELASTTPLAPPPSHPFGSSQFGSGVSKLQFAKGSSNRSSAKSPFGRKIYNSGTPQSQRFLSSPNRFGRYSEWSEGQIQEPNDEQWDEESSQQLPQFGFQTSELADHHGMGPPGQSLMKFSTASLKRSQQKTPNRWSRTASQLSQLPRKGNEDFIPGLARDLCKRLSSAKLDNDSDDVIVGSEQVLRQLDEETLNTKDNSLLDQIVSECAGELEALWKANSNFQNTYNGLEIGPDTAASSFENARFIVVLILQLYEPPLDEDFEPTPMAWRLLNWLNAFHASYDIAFNQTVNTSPNPTASELFWEVIENLTSRGRFVDVMRLLAEADFAYACIDTDRGIEEANYNGAEQQAIQAAVYRTRQILNACPAVQSDDWNMDSQDWDVFRKEVEVALEDLTDLASGADDDEDLSRHVRTLSSFATSRKQGKGLPFDIYGHLKTVYGILLGSSSEIISISNDWLEAAMLLTVWWNVSSEQQVAKWSFDVSQANKNQEVSRFHENQYLRRLKDSFLAVTDPDSEESFQLNPLSPIHLAVGTVLQGDLPSAFKILQSFSLCVTSAITEIGTSAGWLGDNLPPSGLSREDLMVLTNGANDLGFKRDDILERYARALFGKPMFRTSDGVSVEGWELAFSVASRMEDQNKVESTISSFLDELPVTQEDRAEKLVSLCGELGLVSETRRISEAFGDYLVNNTTNYGMALLCYARSHAEAKVRQVIDLLNSYCLVQSKAYPSEPEIDSSLNHLVSNPRAALSGIAEIDPVAVETLQFYLVGYACLRRFYSLRDDQLSSSASTSDRSSTLIARKKSAARALLAAINSAADSIYGGLYDPERQSAIQVDGLLALLGEATTFIAHAGEELVLTSEQMYTLLAAIEDIQTVSSRVFSAAQECLEAALRNYHGSLPPSPHAMLKKSMSSGTNSNFSFSMMGSEMLSRSEESIGGKSLGSAVLVSKADKDGVSIQRGWDWRARFNEPGANAADVLRYLRTGIAENLSVANLEEGLLI